MIQAHDLSMADPGQCEQAECSGNRVIQGVQGFQAVGCGLQEAKMGNNNPGIYNIGNLYVDMVYTYLHMYLTIYMYYVELCD
jgi:hypothetical protein